MNLTLRRTNLTAEGIFGDLVDAKGRRIGVTLEHAFGDGPAYSPKIPDGTWTCVRSMHRLHGMTEDFETFEVTGVPGHTGLLFHWGNVNKDSDGCILVGGYSIGTPPTEVRQSRAAFADFMQAQEGVDAFTLMVLG